MICSADHVHHRKNYTMGTITELIVTESIIKTFAKDVNTNSQQSTFSWKFFYSKTQMLHYKL